MHFEANDIEGRDFNAEHAEVFAKDAEENLYVPLRRPLCPLRLIVCSMWLKPMVVSVVIVGAVTTVCGQRKPSEAIRLFVVMPAQSLDNLQKTLQAENKTSELIDSAGMQLRVAVQHEKNRTGAAAELHDASDDVYYVLDGSATLILGGKLDAPKETDPRRVAQSAHH